MTGIDPAFINDMLDRHFDHVSPRRNDIDVWNTIANSEHTSSEYLHTTIDYHHAYLETATDLSIVIYSNNKAVAIWPLTLFTSNKQSRLQSNCKAILPPIAAKECNKKQIKKIYQQCHSFLLALGQATGQMLSLCYQPTTHMLWQRTFSANIISATYQQLLLADLTGSEASYKQDMRKSYRSLISKGLRLWQHKLYTSMSDQLTEQIRQFHIQVAGKETRSKLTWQLQQQMVNKKEAFLIALYGDNGQQDNALIGAALFNLSPLQASYSIGVYDRNLFDQPISHVIQHIAMQHLREAGIRRYYLGNRHHAFERPKPTDKETSIGFFKEGFSNSTDIEVIAELFLLTWRF